MSREAHQPRCPETVLGWIPWYGEGSLSAVEEGAVEAHAAECAECRAEIEMIAGAPFQIDADLPDPDLAFEQVMARVAARAAGEDDDARVFATDVHESDEDLERVGEWLSEEAEARPPARVIEGPWSRSPAWAAAAACVLVSLGAIGGASVSNEFFGGSSAVNPLGEYRLDSSPTNHTAAIAGTRVEVVFREDVNASEISSALQRLEAEIVSGPSKLGVYQLRLKSEGLDTENAAQIEAVLAELKDDRDGVALYAEEAIP